MKVKKNSLIIFAGVFWIIAGYNVFNISRKIQLNLTPEYNILSFMVFTVFYTIIFKKINKKNIERIKNLDDEVSILKTFNLKSYIIICFMITMGICLRKYSIVSDLFVKSFYLSLGVALFLTGIDSIENYLKSRKEKDQKRDYKKNMYQQTGQKK